MNKFIGIYSKKGKLNISDFKIVFSLIGEEYTRNSENIFTSEYFILICYGSNESRKYLTKSKSEVNAYSGFAYLKSRASKHNCIQAQIIDELKKCLTQEERNVYGKFCFANYNSFEHKLELLNDKYAQFPLYWYEDDNHFLFCNDYEPLAKHNNNFEKLNINSISEYLISGAPQNNKTLFQHIHLLGPGNRITIKNNKKKNYVYYKYNRINKNKSDLNTIAKDFYSAFTEELFYILDWSPKIPVTLTGGTDTRMILGAMSDEERKTREFVTWNSSFIDDSENQDIIIAKLLAKKYNLNYKIETNPLYAINKVNNNYFKTIKETNKLYISGFLGSETLRFEPSYPTNIASFTRNILPSSFEYDFYNDFFIPSQSNKLKILKESIKDYYFPSNKIKLKSLKKEILNNLKNIKAPYSELVYTNMYLMRSFFSRHCGGARSCAIMPVNIISNLISPFCSERILEMIWTVHPKYLNSSKNGLTNIVLSKYFAEFCDLPSNSHLTHFQGTCIPSINEGRQTVYNINVNYDDYIELLDNVFIKNIGLFNTEKIKIDFNPKENKYSYIWYDLLYWLKYISSL